MKVLCTGDLHIGRSPSRLPGTVEVRSLSCAARWEAIVQCALNQGVDLVAISGDLVDQQNKYFEAVGPLEKGIRRLGDAGIATIAVAGNHDFDVLPGMARSLEESRFHLLGRGGTWERVSLQLRNGEHVVVDGWSFPQEHVFTNPLDSHTLGAADSEMHLGLLHADLDAPASAYAPVSLADLRAHPTDLWLLGHVHTPRLESGSVAVLYPGSPQAMDPGEPGEHGVWIGDLRAGEPVALRMVRLSAVQYETVDVDVSDASDPAALMSSVYEQIRCHANRLVASAEGLEHLSLRVRLKGNTTLHRELDELLRPLIGGDDLSAGGVCVWVERVVNMTRPARDLVELSRGRDAPALLARLLLALSDGNVGEPELAILREAEQAATRARSAKQYHGLPGGNRVEDVMNVRDVVAAQATALLEELLQHGERA
jgi:DNA repair exonuclease SbcCD nuclease subunit